SQRAQSVSKDTLESTCECERSDDLKQRWTHFGSRVDLQPASRILEIATKIYPRESSCRQISALNPQNLERQLRPSTRSGVASFVATAQSSSRGSVNSELQTLTTHRLFLRNDKPAHRQNIHLLERYRECLTSKC
ncbi:hypothetical protein M758_10G023800, partial [Ceratodon purpureus]